MAIIRENKFSENIIASGTSTINALTTVVVSTQTRNDNETFMPSGFVTNAVNNASWGESAIAIGLADSVGMFLDRTTNADEFNMNIRNTNAVNSRTIDWKLLKTFSQ